MTVGQKNRLPLINYTNRDYSSLKRSLREHNRRYYSDVSKDENEASFDDMVFDIVAYTGDQLNFYVDYGVNESFLSTAIEYDNVIKHSKQLGYKFRGSPSSYGTATFYAIIPANSSGLGPDARYLPILKRGSECNTTAGIGFILNEDVSFSDPNNEVVVARVNESTGIPTSYVVRAYGQVISGRINEEIITVGSFQKFLRIALGNRNIAEVLSVTDAEGTEYFEVDYLSQDVIYRPIANHGDNKETVTSLLRPFVVPRRYVVERERVRTYLQFGFGSEVDSDSDSIMDPTRVVLDIFGKDYVTDASFDPNNLLGTDKLGISPANTTLRVVYRTNTTNNVNAPTNSLTSMTNPIVRFENIASLDDSLVRSVIDSIEVNNDSPIHGDTTLPTVNELKHQVFDVFGSQNRAVTETDYRAFVYQMPPRFGSIKRVAVFQDPDSFKRNLNMFVVSEAADGTLVQTNDTIKQNLRQWLLRGKMINDTVDILDCKIVNIGIDFVAVSDLESNRFEVLRNAQEAVKRLFRTHQDIGMPFSITKIYDVLNSVDGVVDTTKVRVYIRRGSLYATTRFNIDETISPDGRFIDVPKNVIFEVKYPDSDIRGVIK